MGVIMNPKLNLSKALSLLLIFFSLLFIGFSGEKEKIMKSTLNHTDAYYLKLGRFELPFSNNGILANVKVGSYTSEAKFDGHPVIFAGGFFFGWSRLF